MTIQIDTRDKSKAIKQIVSTFNKENVKYFRSKLFIGDYMRMDNPFLVVDRKQNLLEVCNNVCQDHKRFIAELKRAKEYGIHIVFLVEHGENIGKLEDVREWVNPRLEKVLWHFPVNNYIRSYLLSAIHLILNLCSVISKIQDIE